MVKVSIYGKIEFPAVAEKYAKLLKNWKEEGVLPSVFGYEGAWEQSGPLVASYVSKIHIRLPEEKPWPKEMPAPARKSNSYLVYARHWADANNYHIISIMSPDAHRMARTSFLAELERRAEKFQNS